AGGVARAAAGDERGAAQLHPRSAAPAAALPQGDRAYRRAPRARLAHTSRRHLPPHRVAAAWRGTGKLVAGGAIAIWQDVRPEAREDFFAWHNGEHIPERVGIPGFLRARRYGALAGAPEVFTLYATGGPAVHASSAFLERRNHTTGQS